MICRRSPGARLAAVTRMIIWRVVDRQTTEADQCHVERPIQPAELLAGK